MPVVQIRPASQSDLPVLQEIEVAAGRAFATAGMVEVAGHAPPSIEELTRYLRAGRLWVAIRAGGAGESGAPEEGTYQVAGYLMADDVDGCLHIEQVSVHPKRARRGVGRRLIEHADAVAGQAGLPALTLTTFAEVPWNGPYYARLGFRPLPADEITPGLRSIREHEAAIGLDEWPRICMRREVTARTVTGGGLSGPRATMAGW